MKEHLKANRRCFDSVEANVKTWTGTGQLQEMIKCPMRCSVRSGTYEGAAAHFMKCPNRKEVQKHFDDRVSQTLHLVKHLIKPFCILLTGIGRLSASPCLPMLLAQHREDRHLRA